MPDSACAAERLIRYLHEPSRINKRSLPSSFVHQQLHFCFERDQEWLQQGNGAPLLRHTLFQTSKNIPTDAALFSTRLINYSAPEHDRLNLQTRGFNEMMHGKAFHAPVDRPSRVLEVGAGTGYVTRLLAPTFPQAEVIGLDLSTVPAGEKTKAIFIQGDIMDEGVVNVPLDFIYSRMLVYGGIRNWPAYIARAWDLLAPGGWLETQEVDTSAFFDGDDKNMYPNSSWRNEQRVAFEAKDIDMTCATKLESTSRAKGSWTLH